MDYDKLNEALTKGSNKTMFYVAVVPVNANGEVLVAERKSDGIWTTPAGGAQLDETPEKAAIRECWEEAGLVVIPSMLESLGVKQAPNGKPVHCFLVRTNQTNFTVMMDPDREVDEWKWYSRENLPAGLSRQKNANRLETIGQALMKFYGLSKSDDKSRAHWVSVGTKVEMEHTNDREKARKIALDHLEEDTDYYKDWDNKEKVLFQEKAPKIEKSTIESLIDKLNKGGPGSGIRGHRTPKKVVPAPRAPAPASLPYEKVPEKYHSALESAYTYMADAPDLEPTSAIREAGLNHGIPSGDELSRFVKWALSQYSDFVEKGGPGSGVKGHVTAKKPTLHLVRPGQEPPQVNKVQAHLKLLEEGGVLPGVHTQSGKPIVTSMDAARAQGYKKEDHVDALNVHYNMAQKVNEMIEKMKAAGKAPPKEGVAIAKFHEKQVKAHMKARDQLEDRENELKEHKKKTMESAKKSVTQMGSGLGDRDIDLGSFAQANDKASVEWLERIHSGMEGFGFGDTPRDFHTPKGVLHLCKVDDGLYSGFFTNQELVGDGMLDDNAKVRIERMTIPELIQFMTAKEWIRDRSVAETEAPKMSSEEVGLAYAAEMDRVSDQIALQEKLSRPNPVVATAQFEENEQRIRMLELVAKLLG